MAIFLFGLVLFLGVHTIAMAAPQWRAAQVQRLGLRTWKGLYAVVSAIGFGLFIWGYGVARQAPVVLYTPPAALRHVALLLMLPVFPLLIAAYFPGRISAATKHPMLLATKLWATAHLLANGTLADVLLFGGFLVWAIADRISVKRRAGAKPPPGAPPGPHNDAVALLVGLGLYALFIFWAHRWLIGVSPLPSLR